MDMSVRETAIWFMVLENDTQLTTDQERARLEMIVHRIHELATYNLIRRENRKLSLATQAVAWHMHQLAEIKIHMRLTRSDHVISMARTYPLRSLYIYNQGPVLNASIHPPGRSYFRSEAYVGRKSDHASE